MQKLGWFDRWRLQGFIAKNAQPLRNHLSKEDSFSLLPFDVISKNAVFPEMVFAHTNERLVNVFIDKWPTLFIVRGVLEWDEPMSCDVHGTPGIYIRNVFPDGLPDNVYYGWSDELYGQVLFIPMYINVSGDEEGRVNSADFAE